MASPSTCLDGKLRGRHYIIDRAPMDLVVQCRHQTLLVDTSLVDLLHSQDLTCVSRSG